MNASVCVCAHAREHGVCVWGLEGVGVGQNLSPRDEGYNEIHALI